MIKYPCSHRSMLIALSGVDGSGKSSQTRLLRETFAQAGLRTSIAWMRIGDTPIIYLLRRAIQTIEGRAVDSEDDAQTDYGSFVGRQYRLRGPLLLAWALAASLDYALWLQSLRLRLRRDDIVIADRYYCDFELELGYRLRRWPRLASLLFTVVRRVAPRPARYYLLRVDPDVSRTRKRGADGRGLDLDYLCAAYDELARRHNLHVIDCSPAIDTVARTLTADALALQRARLGGS